LRANQLLNRNVGWDRVAGPGAETEFLDSFAHFLRLDVVFWGASPARARQLLGWIESRAVLLLVELGSKLSEMHARMWPARFTDLPEDEELGAAEVRGFYLIGLVNETQNPQQQQQTPSP